MFRGKYLRAKRETKRYSVADFEEARRQPKKEGSQRRKAASTSQKRQGKGFPLEPPGRN